MKTKAAGISCSTGFKSEEWTTITDDSNMRMDTTTATKSAFDTESRLQYLPLLLNSKRFWHQQRH